MSDPSTPSAPVAVVGTSPYELACAPDETSWTARHNMADILQRELVGPSGGEEELLPESPVTKYMLGKLAPRTFAERAASSTEQVDPEADDEGGRVEGERRADDDSGADSTDDGAEDAPIRRGSPVPASMGLRFQLPADVVTVKVISEWARYTAQRPHDEEGQARTRYARTPVTHATFLDVDGLVIGEPTVIELEPGVELRVDRYDEKGEGGRRHVELALCNVQDVGERIPVGAWMFQTRLIVESVDGAAVFLPVRDVLLDTTVSEDDPEERRLALQYRDTLEFAIGRTTSVDWADPEARRTVRVSTTWTPNAEVPAVDAEHVPGVVLDMRALSDMSREQLDEALRPMHAAYVAWLDGQEDAAAALPEHLREIALEAIADARLVARQLGEGIGFLLDPSHDQARLAFAFMNEVMADQRIHSQITEMRGLDATLTYARAEAGVQAKKAAGHSWRMFQLGFVLMQLPALCDPAHERRAGENANVELLFFPTGGGKTEAYLGLAAFTFAIRRLQGIVGAEGLDGSAGVAVLMRYTLRLLTSQQFQRATTLICAAELKRRANPEMWGDEPFRIGLWVGSDVSPKTVKDARDDLDDATKYTGYRPKTLQIRRCPWCGEPIHTKHATVDEDFERVHVRCGDRVGRCPFADREGLPVLTVDEEIYRLAPTFVIGTVDKFARLAREGQVAALFGYVTERCSRHGFVHPDSPYCRAQSHRQKGEAPPAHRAPATRLRPPDLIIQDELHLITSSLGTTVALFENAIHLLCQWTSSDGRECGPMIVASSATVRSAADQVRQLYGRETTVFPPQVLDAGNTFFSKELTPWRTIDDRGRPGYAPGRLYVGLSTAGTRLTLAEIRSATILLAAGQLLLDRGGKEADPHMTLVGYFSALRELAGMSRFVQDDIRLNLFRGVRGTALPKRRGMNNLELNMAELTSRISGTEITAILDKMSTAFDPSIHSSEVRDKGLRILRDLHVARKAKKKDKALIARLEAELAALPEPTFPYDVVLATSMLQVGVDVTRLGLMLVVGQPKNTAEYIQASSRVGRDRNRPGLVVSLGNTARPRDLVHYEQFRAFHENFYSRVEALSITPYSLTALRRGVPALLVSAARALDACDPEGLSPEKNAGRYAETAPAQRLRGWTERMIERARRAGGDDAARLMRAEIECWLGAWEERARVAAERDKTLVYDRVASRERQLPLVISSEARTKKTGLEERPPFEVPNSMREVQPEINILLSPIEKNLLIPHTMTTPEWVYVPTAGGDDD